MSDDRYEVSFTANAENLTAGAAKASEEVKKATSQMNEAFGKLNGDVAGSIGTMQREVSDAIGGIKGHFGGLEVAMSSVKGALIGVAATLASGKLFKESVEDTVKLTGEANKLARSLGISATEASILNVALGDIYSSSADYIGSFMHFARALRMNQDGLRELGVDVDAFNKGQKTSRQLFEEAVGTIGNYQAGLDQAMAAQTMFGREVDGVMKLQRLNNDVMEEAKKKAEALNLVIGVEGKERVANYRAAMNDLGDTLQGIKKAIGDAVMPVLTDLANWFSSVGPEAVVVIRGAIGGLVAVFYGLKYAVEIVWNFIAYQVEALTINLIRLGTVAAKALALDFTGAKAAWTAGTEQLEEIARKRFDNVVAAGEEAQKRLYALFSGESTADSAKHGGSKKAPTKSDKDGKTGGEESLMSQYELRLADMKVAYQKENDLRQMAKQQELEYWQSLINSGTVGSKDAISIRRKMAELELDILKQSKKDRDGLRREEVDEDEKRALHYIQVQQAKAEEEAALGNITNKTLLEMKRKFEEERYRIEAEAQQRRFDLAKDDPNSDPVALQKLEDQKMQIYRKHLLERGKLERDYMLESNKGVMAVNKSMEDGLAKGMKALITNWKNAGKAIKSIFKDIFSTFLTEMITKPLAETAMRLMRESTLYQAFFGVKKGLIAADVSAQISADSAGAASTVAKGAAELPVVAGTAAGKAADSVASIPYVGPALAAAAFAATMAMVMGASRGGGSGGGGSGSSGGISLPSGGGISLPSAFGGFDIPAGVNPITQLHEQEMVLPSEHANVIRDLAANGGGAGHTFNITIQAMDGADVRRVLVNNSHHVATALSRAARNFSPVKS